MLTQQDVVLFKNYGKIITKKGLECRYGHHLCF